MTTRLTCLSLLVSATSVAWSAHAAHASHEITQIAAMVGVPPESLVVAGVTAAADVNQLLTRIEAADNEWAALQAAQGSLDAAGSEVSTLTGLLAASPNDSQLLASYDAAVASLAQADAAFSAAQNSLVTFVEYGLEPEVTEALQRWRAASSYTVEPAFRVLPRTSEQWRAVEVALRSEQRSMRSGVPLDPDHAQLLQAIRAEAEVIAAQYAIETHLANVQQLFDQFQGE